ncbi:hypothetical protein WJX74_011068 [Apatococcus lobatus]|uniref:CBM20 domain-containing protein n=1 Tax=Apatococcus lobatus TaxID=904363 RepID=A0AAW1RI46_9CHLO
MALKGFQTSVSSSISGSKAPVGEPHLPATRSRRRVLPSQQSARCLGSATADSATKPVSVSFSTHYKAAFGDKLKLVGNHEATGSWDLDDAPEMKWHDGNVWTANLEVPTGTELEYKLLHVHPHGVRWESIDNRVLTISAATDLSQQDFQDVSAAGSKGLAVLDTSNGAEQVGTLAAIEVVCAWDLPAPVEVAFNLDPQAPTIPPDNGSADVPPAVDNSSSQDTISKGSSEQPPQAALIESEHAAADSAAADGSSSSQLAVSGSLLGAQEKGVQAEQLRSADSVQAAEGEEREMPVTDLDPARAALPEDFTQAVYQQSGLSDQDPGWEALTEAQHQEGTAISGPAALSLHMQELVQQAAPASISAETLNHVHDTASLEETPQTGLSKIQSGQEAAPAGAPEKEQQADESPEQQAVPSKQAPEEQQQQQPQQIQPGVQVIEQPGSTGELPTYLFSFDEHQDMQPFVETESEDEMDISAARESDNNPEGTQPAAVADPPPTSHDDLQLAQQRASLPPVKPHLPKSSRSRSAPQPQAALDARGASAPRPVKRSKPAAEGEVKSKQIGSVGQLAGVAAMGMAAGIVASGVSVELADAAVISALIAAGAAVLPSTSSLDDNGNMVKRSVQGKGAGDVALGALAMGLNAAEGIARTLGLGRQQDSLEADADDDDDYEEEEEEEGHEFGYDAEDEEDSCWEEESEEWESPAEALMSATDQLAASIMEAQGMESGNLLEAEEFATNFLHFEE